MDIIVHETTVSTNALVEGKTDRAGLIVNHSHADILTLREGPRKSTWNCINPSLYPAEVDPHDVVASTSAAEKSRGCQSTT